MSNRGLIQSTGGLIGITGVTALGFRGSRNFLQIANNAASGGGSIAFCLVPDDQNVPALTTLNIGGITTVTIAGITSNVITTTLAPGEKATFAVYAPTNAIAIVASTAGVPVSILYATGGTGA